MVKWSYTKGLEGNEQWECSARDMNTIRIRLYPASDLLVFRFPNQVDSSFSDTYKFRRIDTIDELGETKALFFYEEKLQRDEDPYLTNREDPWIRYSRELDELPPEAWEKIGPRMVASWRPEDKALAKKLSLVTDSDYKPKPMRDSREDDKPNFFKNLEKE